VNEGEASLHARFDRRLDRLDRLEAIPSSAKTDDSPT
jgi:hypothetical protein